MITSRSVHGRTISGNGRCRHADAGPAVTQTIGVGPGEPDDGCPDGCCDGRLELGVDRGRAVDREPGRWVAGGKTTTGVGGVVSRGVGCGRGLPVTLGDADGPTGPAGPRLPVNGSSQASDPRVIASSSASSATAARHRHGGRTSTSGTGTGCACGSSGGAGSVVTITTSTADAAARAPRQ